MGTFDKMTVLDPSLCVYYAFTDPASGHIRGSSKSIKQAKQAITVAAVSPITQIFCVFAWCGKLSTTAYVDKLLWVHAHYKPKLFGIEANAMQSLFADQVRAQAKKALKRVAFLSVSQPTNVDKTFRIATAIEPTINYGRLFIQSSQVELESGLRGFPASGTYLDLIDCWASTIRLIPRRAVSVTRNEQLRELASYLRHTGAPSWYIEQRIAEERQAITRKQEIES